MASKIIKCSLQASVYIKKIYIKNARKVAGHFCFKSGLQFLLFYQLFVENKIINQYS